MPGPALAFPDVETRVIAHLRPLLLAGTTVTNQFTLDPQVQLPLVVVRAEGGGTLDQTLLVEQRLVVDVWAETRADALGLSNAVYRGLLARAGFPLGLGAAVSRVAANPPPQRLESGDATNRIIRINAGYDLTIRCWED